MTKEPGYVGFQHYTLKKCEEPHYHITLIDCFCLGVCQRPDVRNCDIDAEKRRVTENFKGIATELPLSVYHKFNKDSIFYEWYVEFMYNYLNAQNKTI